MSEERPTKTPDPSAIPDAPAAHTPGGSPPTPPAWSYRAGASPNPGPAGERSASRGSVPVQPRPVGASRPADTPVLPVRGGSISLGPAGRERSPLAVALLSMLTLGLYALVWHRRINNEMSDFDPRMRVRAGGSVLAVTIAWLLGLIVSLAGAARIVLDAFHVSLPFDPHFTVTQAYYLLGAIVVVPYLILVLPFALVAVVMTLERIRIVQDRVGVSVDSQLQPAHAVWWLIVPVVGGLAMIASMQRRLNRVWQQASVHAVGRRA